MEVKPGYKQTGVGVIPEEWGLKTLFELAERKRELFNDGDWIESEHITTEGIRLIQTGNIGVGRFTEKDAKKYIYEKSFTSLRCKQLRRGDLLVCRLADPAGRACVLPDIGEERIVTSVDVTIFRPPSEMADRVFLSNVFSTPEWFRAVSDRSGGTTHKRISRSALGRIAIAIPPLPEQRAIATALSDADALLGGLDRLIAKKRDLKQAAMQQLLTGQTRLPGYHGEWEVKRLEQSCELITKGTTPTSMGRSFTESGVNFLKAESLSESGETIPDKVAFIDTATHKLLKRSQLKAGDLLISIAGVLGRVGRVSQGILPANTNQALAIVRLGNASELDRNFLFFCLRSPMTAKQISDVNVQAAQANISLQNVRDLEIHVPPTIPEQTTIAEVLTEMDAELAALTLRREKTHALKQAMMQELLTGRTRLLSPDAGTKTEVQR